MYTKNKSEEKLVSIVIPVYNVENYLRECIESIIAQTYKNIEVILIDDGSTDSSGAICDEYAHKYSFIRAKHQSNKGISAARNAGIGEIRGSCYCFIDSDDWIDEDYIETLLINMTDDTDVVVSVSQKSYISINENYHDCDNKKLLYTYDDNEQIRKVYLSGGERRYFIAVYYKLYSSRLKNIYFDTEMPVGEDIIYNIEILKNADRIRIINYTGYHVRDNEYSTTKKIANRYTPLYEHTYTLITKKIDCARKSIGATDEDILQRAVNAAPMRYFKEINNLFNAGSPYTTFKVVCDKIEDVHKDKEFVSRIRRSRFSTLTNTGKLSKILVLLKNKYLTYIVFSAIKKCKQ